MDQDMDEEHSMQDSGQLLQSATDFAHYPGYQTNDAAKEFLDRFPLPVLINALQVTTDVAAQSALVACLERIFKTKYGASFIPSYMEFVQLGLQANSNILRSLACNTVACLLENSEENISAAQLVIDQGFYPLLLDCLVKGDEQVAVASMEAIKKLAASQQCMEIIFPPNANVVTHLGHLSARCSSLGRARVLSLIVKLFSISTTMASAVYHSNLLTLLEAEINNTEDILASLCAMELFYEMAEVQHGAEFLSRTSLIQLLSSVIRKSTDAILRSRATMISARLLSNENIYIFIDESSVKTLISAISGRLESEGLDMDEYELALDALGQIGSSIPGATLLLSISPPPARHVIHAAFDRQAHGKQLSALHALGNITGETRPEGNRLLNIDAEENLRRLIYETASGSSKLTPSGLFLSTLQQDSEIRLAAHRMLTGLVARAWCLMEICSKQDIVSIVTDPNTETTKIGMETRYDCCKAIQRAFMSSTKLSSTPALSGIADRLEEAVSRGPYLNRRGREAAQPMVKTADGL